MKPERLTAAFFLSVVIIFMCLAFVGFAIRKINKLIHYEQAPVVIDIDWEKIYPFTDNELRKAHLVHKTLIEALKEKVSNNVSQNMFYYHRLVEAAKFYEELIGWNMAAVLDYNPVIKLNDGYLSGLVVSRDTSGNADAVKGLNDFCRESGIEFLYLNLPTKICISEDSDISGTLDFSNQNTDRLLQQLKAYGVRYYDFRRLLHEDDMSHHEAFFVTDHHWKPESGLWAAKHILQILRDNYGWNIKPEILNPDNFEHVIYRDWFLGSQGKKLTLSRTRPDNFTMLFPTFNTRLRFEVPLFGIDTTGDFNVIYQMSHAESCDYYGLNSYAAYKYADQPLTRLHNLLNHYGRKLLIIHESFSNCVIPFVALGIEYTDEIDLRSFSGSLRNYITSSKPDAVIVAYHSGVPGRGGKTASYEENEMYDFR